MTTLSTIKENPFLRKLHYYGKICQYAYLDKNEFDQRAYKTLRYYSAPQFFNQGKTQVYSFITRELIESTVHDQLLICYRGTDELGDWNTNFSLKKVPLIIDGQTYGKVHSGFYNYTKPANDFVKQQVREFLGNDIKDIVYEQSEINKEWLENKQIHIKDTQKTIVFCGHSLGGSAVIPALQTALLKEVYCPVKMISFGSPRIGDRQFEDLVDQIIPNNLRVVNKEDIVPYVPSRFLFKHTPNMLHLKQNDYEWREFSDDINFFELGKYLYDTYLNFKMKGIIYLFQELLNKSKSIQHHFMDDYIEQLEKYDL